MKAGLGAIAYHCLSSSVKSPLSPLRVETLHTSLRMRSASARCCGRASIFCRLRRRERRTSKLEAVRREHEMVRRGATHTVPPTMKTTATAIRAKTCGRTPTFTTAVGDGCAGFWRRTTVGPSCSAIAVMRSSGSG